MVNKNRVVVAMSGGVDSSVAAVLLKREGRDVIGVTMEILPRHPHGHGGHFGGCCSASAIEDARRVAKKIGIPHYVVNFRKIFREKVIDNFVREYERGRTPNPCIRCNRFIKFDALLRRARELSAVHVATGHYARVKYDTGRKRWLLFRGADINKDQSYVLYSLKQGQLKNVLLPLGELTKNEVREIARGAGLSVADKAESQDICFIPDEEYPLFPESRPRGDVKNGAILDLDGKAVGEHKGVTRYTIGQRRGLGIAARKPLYVIAINPRNNTIIVGPERTLYRNTFLVKETNLISVKGIASPVRAGVKIRYKHKAADAVVSPSGKGWVAVKFKRPQRAITPGQSAVFYDGNVVIGGGIIAGIRRN